MNDVITKVVGVICLAVINSIAVAQTSSYLYYFSSDGDYIGQGQEQTLSSTDGTVTASASGANDSVSFSWDGASIFWNLVLKTANDVVLAIGNYEDAVRAVASTTNPGLDFSGDGRGCNTLAGRFVVYEVTFAGPGNVTSYAADFEQHCEVVGPALLGRVRYNSAVPFDEGEPRAQAGSDLVTVDGLPISLDGRASTSGTLATISSYQWSVTNSVSALINDNSSALATIMPTNAVPPNDADVTANLQLRVSNTHKYEHTDSVSVRVKNKNGPQNYVYLDSASGDAIGLGLKRFLDAEGATFTATQSNNQSVSIAYNAGVSWSLQFAAPVGSELAVGRYENVVQLPMNMAEGGLDISGEGRSCTLVAGNFEIFEFEVDGLGNVVRFSADFEQFCDGSLQPLLGQVRFNSVDPSTPTANAGADQVIVFGGIATLDGRQSVDSDGTIASYQWTQTQGPTVWNITGADSPILRVGSPVIPSGQSEVTLEFQLQVVDAQGFRSTDVASITVTQVGSGGSSGSGSSGGGSSVGSSGGSTSSDINTSSSGGGGSLGFFIAFVLFVLSACGYQNRGRLNASG